MALNLPSHEQSLPGTVAEIRRSEAGPHIGAFFDLDGTLVAGFTAAAVSREQTKSGMISRRDLVRSLGPLLSFARGTMAFEDLLATTVRPMKGMPATEIDDLGRRVFAKKINDLIYPEMRRLVRAHMEQGHTVVLSSSAMTLQVEPVAEFLGIEHVLCNRLVSDDEGNLTGELVQPVIWGAGKSNAVQGFVAENGLDLKKSYFYADGDEDTALMYVIGKPRPTNPRAKLAAVAARRGWPVLRFSSRGAGGMRHVAKQLFGLSSLASLAATGAAIGFLAQDKRKGVNVLLRSFPNLFLKLNNVELNVTGAENLEAVRPAIFVFNHRTNADSFIAAQLLGHDYTGVAKKELEKDPFMGPVGKMMDVAFLDRGNSASAVAEMKKMEDLARKGLSVLVAPEGTRVDTTSVGTFKKGAFRMAMGAGLPIIPIIIRNAEDIAGLDSHTFNPGVVDVHIGDPIDTSDWTLATLNDRIADVRQIYIDQLAAWPGRPAPMTDPAGHTSLPAKKAAPAKKTSAKKAPAKKAPATKTSAKKAPAKKAPATKAPATKAPVTKAPAKKAPATKAAATQPAEPKPATKKAVAKKTATAKQATRTPAKNAVLGKAVSPETVAPAAVVAPRRSRTSGASRALNDRSPGSKATADQPQGGRAAGLEAPANAPQTNRDN